MTQDTTIAFAVELFGLLIKQDAILPLASHVPDHAFLESLSVAAEKVESAITNHYSDPALAALVQELRLVMRDVRLAIESGAAARPDDGLDPTLLFPAVSTAIGDILQSIEQHG